VSRQNPKRTLFTEFAAVAKAAAHPHRLELLEQLAQGERSVERLAERVGLSVANASQHLQHMRRAGLVTTRREGRFVVYSLTDDAVLSLLESLRRIAEVQSAEVDRVVRTYFEDRDSLEAVTRSELVERLQRDAATVLDVRPGDEFALGHLPGALNVPLNELEAHLSAFDSSREIVAYCRGPYCVLSYEAVAMLRARGFNVRRLEDGLPEWRAAGLPVEVGVAG
jgi:rhodanese-related sulfurtransferase/predicted transcriptional regulator